MNNFKPGETYNIGGDALHTIEDLSDVVLKVTEASCLRALAEAKEEYQRWRAADRLMVDDAERQRMLALASNFPAVWNDPRTAQRER